MRTDDLIADLSADVRLPVWQRPTPITVAATGAACAIVVAISAIWLGFSDGFLSRLSNSHAVLLNLVFIVSVGCATFVVIRDLSIPGRRVSIPTLVLAAPFAFMAFLVVRELLTRPFHQLVAEVGHESWIECFLQTMSLAIPAFLILAIGMRRLAPTNLPRAGAYIGLLAGSIGALGFCLHSPDETILFSTTVYVAEIAGMAALGFVSGPRLLRWR